MRFVWLAVVACMSIFAIDVIPGRVFGQTSKPSGERPSLAWTVQTTLGIRPTHGAEVFEQIQSAAKVMASGKQPVISDALGTLARTFNEGVKPEIFQDELVQRVHIPTYVSPDSTAFNDNTVRLHLAKLMLTHAKASTNADEAAQLARAALLFGAHADLEVGSAAVRSLDKDFDHYAQLAKLNEQQARTLKTIIHARQAAYDEYFDAESPAVFARDKIAEVKAGQPVPESLLNGAFTFFRLAWTKAPPDTGNCFRTIHDLWLLRNIGVERGDRRIVEGVDALLTDWTADVPEDVLLSQWLTEAKQAVGKPPARPAYSAFPKDHPYLKELARKLANPPANPAKEPK